MNQNLSDGENALPVGSGRLKDAFGTRVKGSTPFLGLGNDALVQAGETMLFGAGWGIRPSLSVILDARSQQGDQTCPESRRRPPQPVRSLGTNLKNELRGGGDSTDGVWLWIRSAIGVRTRSHGPAKLCGTCRLPMKASPQLSSVN